MDGEDRGAAGRELSSRANSLLQRAASVLEATLNDVEAMVDGEVSYSISLDALVARLLTSVAWKRRCAW